MNLVDLIPEKNEGTVLFFTSEQADLVQQALSSSGLADRVYNHANSVDIGKDEDDFVQVLPDGSHREIAALIDKTIPDAPIETKVTLFNVSEMALAKAARGLIESRVSIEGLSGLVEVLKKHRRG